MKLGVVSALLIAVVWCLLALAQLWVQIFSVEIFFKISVTAGILLALIVVVTLVVREYLSEQKLKEDGFIDG